jgi:hypothetical protein
VVVKPSVSGVCARFRFKRCFVMFNSSCTN